MNICVVGTGYVGLVTGAVFADLGNDVVCVDKIHAEDRRAQGRARCRSTSPASRRWSPATSTTAGSPSPPTSPPRSASPTSSSSPWARRRRTSGETDLSHVEAVAAEIGRAMDRYKVVVNKSTVPVGTGRARPRGDRPAPAAPIEFDVVSNPEFLREGSAIEDTLRPDRIVIGAAQPAGRDDARGALRPARAADDHHRPALGGGHQVRLQRLPRRQDLLHQRASPTSARPRAPTSAR